MNETSLVKIGSFPESVLHLDSAEKVLVRRGNAATVAQILQIHQGLSMRLHSRIRQFPNFPNGHNYPGCLDRLWPVSTGSSPPAGTSWARASSPGRACR